MNADGTIKKPQESYVEPTQEQPKQKPDNNTVKEEYHRRKRKVHDFNLFKRHPNCECRNCWKNFGLMTVFYFIVIYLLYLIVQTIFSVIDKEEVKTLTTPVIATTPQQ
jgi:hypothetical protein